MENEYLCWVNLVGKDVDEIYTYEFLFSDNPDEFWGDDFENKPMGLCNNLTPYENCYNVKKEIKTNIKLDLVQNNCCLSFTDCIDGIIALCWYIDDKKKYSLSFHYADTYNEVEKKLAEKNIILE